MHSAQKHPETLLATCYTVHTPLSGSHRSFLYPHFSSMLFLSLLYPFPTVARQRRRKRGGGGGRCPSTDGAPRLAHRRFLSPSDLLPRRQAWIRGRRCRRVLASVDRGGRRHRHRHFSTPSPFFTSSLVSPKTTIAPRSWRGSELCLGGGESLSWLHEGE